MTGPLILIVNPHSAKGATGRAWPRLEKVLRRLLPPFDVAVTRRHGDAERLAAEAAPRYETVVAVGGDGTINEVANGIIESGSAAAMGLLPRGTGSDFVRTIGIPHNLRAAARVLAAGKQTKIDVGLATFRADDGRMHSRWFVNAAEVGFGAMVSDAVNHPSRFLPGPAAFMWAIVATLFKHRPSPSIVTAEGASPRSLLLSNAWVANGRYSGGGIKSARRARIDDGLLDLVLVEHASPFVRLAALPKLRSGKFVTMRQVEYRQITAVSFLADPAQPVELDGEVVGMTEATFKVEPARLTVITGGMTDESRTNEESIGVAGSGSRLG